MITIKTYDNLQSVTLPDPILGDSEQYNIQVKYEFSMSRKVHSSKKTNVRSKFLLTFEEITDSQKVDLESFLLAIRGYNVTALLKYTDYYSNLHWGTILGDPIEFIHKGTNECTNLWTVTLEFEGAKP